MKIVISLGGSLLTRELTAENFKRYADAAKRLHDSGHDIIIVCGGGKTCRDYQDVARNLGANREQLDFIGIMSTHLNASTFCYCLGNLGYLVKWKVLKETDKEIKSQFGKKIIVAGGYDVGTSSDYDAAYFAKLVKADLLINASNVDGVYDKDPKEHPDAKKIDRLTHDEFIKIIKQNEQAPGEYRLFDLAAAKLVKELKLKTLMISGVDPERIFAAVEGRHSGTEIG